MRNVPAHERASLQLRDGDLLVEKSGGTPANPVGFVAQYQSAEPAVASNFIARLRVDQDQDPNFWRYALTASYLDGRTRPFVKQTTGIQNLDIQGWASSSIPVPPLDKQRTIANFLDRETAKIDALIDRQEILTTLLNERRSSLAARVSQAGEVAHGEGRRLKHFVVETRQGWSPQCYNWPRESRDEWAVLKTGAVNGGNFQESENKVLPPDVEPRPESLVQQGDLVMSRANTRELVGSAAVVDREYPRLMLSDKLYAFTLSKDVNPSFVATVLGTRVYRDLIELEATGASPSMQNITQEVLRNLPLDLPSRPEQDRRQAKIDRETAKIDTLIAKVEEHITLAKERRAALITAAVTGQIDVTGKAA